MKKVIFILVGAVLLFGFALKSATWLMPYFAPSRYGTGSLFLADAENVSSIVVKRKNEKIKLKKVDGSWFCNGYFAKNAVIETLLRRLGQAEVIATIDEKLTADQSLELKDETNKVFYFELVSAQKGNSTVIVDNKSYVLDDEISLPESMADFFVQPLLSIADDDIEQFVGIEAVSSDLANIEYSGALKEIPQSMINHEYKSFVLIGRNGVKYVCGLYKSGDDYLMTLSLRTTIMPTIEADEYVKQNGFRYEGWYFEIPFSDGNRLWKRLTKN